MLTIRADSLDTVVPMEGEGVTVTATGSVAQGEDGSVFALYEYVGGGGEVLASLGIDTDATVDLLPSA